MKKLMKIASVAMASLMMISMAPFTSASAASKKEVNSSNVDAGIKLSWAETKNAGKYTIYRSEKNSGTKTIIATTKKTAFTDKEVKAGKTYYYTVKTSNGTAYAKEKAVRLNSPKLKKAKLNKYDEVNLKWTAVKGAAKYKIYRAKVKADGTVGEFKYRWSTKKTKTWDYIFNCGTFMYKITAVCGDSESAMSNGISIIYVPTTYLFPALSADYSSVEVSFYPVKGVDGYRIYRSTSVDPTEKLIADIPASEANVAITDEYGYTSFDAYIYTDTDIEFGVGYVYSIETYKGENTSMRNTQFSEAIYLRHADIDLKVGETNSEISTVLKELLEYYDTAIESGEIQNQELNITAVSENPEIATIDENYVITAIAPGETVITFTVSGKIGDEKFEDRITLEMSAKMSVYVGE